MKLPENDYQILRLLDSFYQKYPNPPYREILKKQGRAYNCLLFQTHYNYFICIPYRSEITHPFSYLFQKSKRSQKHSSGLDYTKILIVNKTEYLDNKNALIDKDEFIETIKNLEKIKQEALKYVEDYVSHINRSKLLHPAEFKRKYAFSTLSYFHDELGLTKSTFV
ncbi:MAG: hypothetical protein IJZ53_10220 [Tyzzerella sp.]|nr:hypothetical protein [Tyzzerella sp.]